MAFNGLASNELNTASLIQRSIAERVGQLAFLEAPVLDFLGIDDEPATSIKHEFIEDQLLPRTITVSTAINSAAVATPIGIQVGPPGIGLSLNVGQLLRNRSAAPEVYQVTSIVGSGNSIVVSRDYAGTTVAGSLAAGGTLYVGGSAAIEGQDHSGADTRRLGTVRYNTVGYFKYELAQSNTQFSIAQVGNDRWEDRQDKALAHALAMLEQEVLSGVLNGTNSLGTTSATRTMQGVIPQLTSVNSTITSSSFIANPHLYIGNVWEAAYNNGAGNGETWGIAAGSTWFKALSDLNDTKVQDSNQSEAFKRVIRTYTGPFGQAQLMLARSLGATELILIPRERVRVKNLQGRSFNYMEMAPAGDNRKGMIVGEYVQETYHQAAMARLTA